MFQRWKLALKKITPVTFFCRYVRMQRHEDLKPIPTKMVSNFEDNTASEVLFTPKVNYVEFY